MPYPKRKKPDKNGMTDAGWQQGHFPAQPPMARQYNMRSAPASADRGNPARKRKQFWLIFLLSGLALMLAGAGLLVPEILARKNRQKAEAALQTLFYQEALPETPSPPSPSPAIMALASAVPELTAAPPLRSFATRSPWKVDVTRGRFLPLRKINKDVAGWLTIGKAVDLPVVQRDNSYYLTHDFYGHASSSGTLFLDENYSITPPSENLLIHGHNMRDGSMFGRLYQYRDKAFYAGHWLIKFETLYEEANYAVFAAFTMVNDIADPSYFRYAYSGFDTDAQFTQFISAVKQRSVMRCDLDVAPADSLLTLSTCIGANSYFVVIARRIRDAEALSSVEMTCNLSVFR